MPTYNLTDKEWAYLLKKRREYARKQRARRAVLKKLNKQQKN